jgi:hypothetical protein
MFNYACYACIDTEEAELYAAEAEDSELQACLSKYAVLYSCLLCLICGQLIMFYSQVLDVNTAAVLMAPPTCAMKLLVQTKT